MVVMNPYVVRMLVAENCIYQLNAFGRSNFMVVAEFSSFGGQVLGIFQAPFFGFEQLLHNSKN